MAIRSVSIKGDGIAARCCAHLLTIAGFEVSIERTDRPRVPVLMLSDPAVSLMRDVFGQRELLAGGTRIRSRVVAWGPDHAGGNLPHEAIAVSEGELLESLSFALPSISIPQPDFTIYASGPLPALTTPHGFGNRRAAIARIKLDCAGACYVESVEAGWLFAIPSQDSAWLLSIGGNLAQSKLIAPHVLACEHLPGEFSTNPRISLPLTGENWLACGSAALAFDPICGDGTAQAVREAILASAVVCGIASGGDAEALKAHYETRLLAGMHRHLGLCAEYYRSGGAGPWWQAQTADLVAGFEWCGSRLQSAPPPRYRLQGFELTTID